MASQTRKPIDEVVSELGRYPMEAFDFVQQCIGLASERVHGAMSPAELTVAKWMAANEVDLDELRRRNEEKTLPPDVADALLAAGGPEKMNRHITGAQLCWAVRDAALERWGLMARTVLARWNVTRTEDIGAIIFALVDSNWLQKQPTDRIEDFDHVFPFEEAFDQHYRIH